MSISCCFLCSQDSLSMTFDQRKATSDMVSLSTLDSDTQHGYIVGSSMVLILGLKWLHMCIMPPFCTCRIVFDLPVWAFLVQPMLCLGLHWSVDRGMQARTLPADTEGIQQSLHPGIYGSASYWMYWWQYPELWTIEVVHPGESNGWMQLVFLSYQ